MLCLGIKPPHEWADDEGGPESRLVLELDDGRRIVITALKRHNGGNAYRLGVDADRGVRVIRGELLAKRDRNAVFESRGPRNMEAVQG